MDKQQTTMPVKIPKSVQVGGITVGVRVDPDLEDWGQYRADEKEIVLSTKTISKASSLRETLRHEMLHAAFDISGISHLQRFEEESIVRAVDHIFHPAWEAIRKQIGA